MYKRRLKFRQVMMMSFTDSAWNLYDADDPDTTVCYFLFSVPDLVSGRYSSSSLSSFSSSSSPSSSSPSFVTTACSTDIYFSVTSFATS